MLINNPAIVPKPVRLFSNRRCNRLATRPASLDNQAMNVFHPRFIIPALAALLTLAPARAESPADSPAPVRHAAGNPDAGERLLRQLEADVELITLTLEESRFHLVFYPAEAPVPDGNLLILPDMDAGPGWLEQGLAVSRYLARHGWNSLILQPPSPPDMPLPQRTLPSLKAIRPGSTAGSPAAETPPTEDSATSEASPEATAPPEQPAAGAPALSFTEQMQQQLSLAQTELQQRSHADTAINVILGIGHSAPWAAAFAVAQGDEWNLVMVNPRSAASDKVSLTEQLPLIKGQVIDLYYLPLPGYPEAAPDARLRRRLAARHDMTNYHQTRLPGPFRGWRGEMSPMVRQLRGLLERVLLIPAAEEAEAPPPPEAQTPPGTRDTSPVAAPGG